MYSIKKLIEVIAVSFLILILISFAGCDSQQPGVEAKMIADSTHVDGVANADEDTSNPLLKVTGNLNLLYASVADLKNLYKESGSAPGRGKLVFQYMLDGGELTMVAFAGQRNHKAFDKNDWLKLGHLQGNYGTIPDNMIFGDQELSRHGPTGADELKILADSVRHHPNGIVLFVPSIVNLDNTNLPAKKIEYKLWLVDQLPAKTFDSSDATFVRKYIAVSPNPCPPYDGY
ncbi:MAG: hypothetical protein ABIO82_00350 [Ginsengibacter sp.]